MELDNRYIDTWTPLGDLVDHRADDPGRLAEGRRALSRTFASSPPAALAAAASLAASTLFVMAATLASTLLGFMREVVNARYYGTHWEMDTFLAAATIPTILFGVFNGALVSALVPTFSEYLAHGQEDDAWRLASTILNLLRSSSARCARRRAGLLGAAGTCRSSRTASRRRRWASRSG